jgi:hypothetical protein
MQAEYILNVFFFLLLFTYYTQVEVQVYLIHCLIYIGAWALAWCMRFLIGASLYMPQLSPCEKMSSSTTIKDEGISIKKSQVSRGVESTKGSYYDNILAGEYDQFVNDEYEDDDVARLPSTPLKAQVQHQHQHQQQKQQSTQPEFQAAEWSDLLAERGDIAELCQYVQSLELEKKQLQEHVHFLQEENATYKIQLGSTQKRMEILETSLKSYMDEKEEIILKQQFFQSQLEAEKNENLVWLQKAQDLEKQLQDTERARQHAVFRLSEIQAHQAIQNNTKLLSSGTTKFSNSNASSTSPASISREEDDVSFRRREIELLHQHAALEMEQNEEATKVQLEISLRKAQMEYHTRCEKMKLEYELKLNQWRHEEAMRAKEIEAKMEEDRYSIRLELKHGIQRAQIDQRVSFLQAQAAVDTQQQTLTFEYTNSMDHQNFNFDEMLVRLQLDQMRTRRLDAIKKILLIRKNQLEKATKEAFCCLKVHVQKKKTSQYYAVLAIHRILGHIEARKRLNAFDVWRFNTQSRRIQYFQQNALACWNRMLAVERMNHLFQQRLVRNDVLYSIVTAH